MLTSYANLWKLSGFTNKMSTNRHNNTKPLNAMFNQTGK